MFIRLMQTPVVIPCQTPQLVIGEVLLDVRHKRARLAVEPLKEFPCHLHQGVRDEPRVAHNLDPVLRDDVAVMIVLAVVMGFVSQLAKYMGFA